MRAAKQVAIGVTIGDMVSAKGNNGQLLPAILKDRPGKPRQVKKARFAKGIGQEFLVPGTGSFSGSRCVAHLYGNSFVGL